MNDFATRDQMARVEQDVTVLKAEVASLTTDRAVSVERHKTVIGRLDKLDGHMTWMVRLILGSIILAFLAFMYKGGISV